MAWDEASLRDRINTYPPYVGAGIEVTYVAPDASELRVEMPLTATNENVVGTHFGGSLYAMVDPHLMLLLQVRLGPGYVVWDKAAEIDFVRPGRGTVASTIRVSDDDVRSIREATANGEKHFPEWTLDVLDEEGEVVTRVRKVLYVRKAPALKPPEARS